MDYLIASRALIVFLILAFVLVDIIVKVTHYSLSSKLKRSPLICLTNIIFVCKAKAVTNIVNPKCKVNRIIARSLIINLPFI